MSETIERRTADVYEGAATELRVESAADGKPAELFGYAVRFNSLSKDLGGFRERILPGAFDRVLESGADVRALVDHDHTKLLGRTSAGTLKIGKDDRGLWFRVQLPETQYARDVRALVDRGDVRGMSFGFTIPVGGDRFTREGGAAVREVTEAGLKEVTVTSIPAYTDTSVYLRVDPGIAARIPAADPPAPPAPTAPAAAVATPARDVAARRAAVSRNQ